MNGGIKGLRSLFGVGVTEPEASASLRSVP